ncbi:hypothetical protein COY91_01180 [Candidatus Shapirobacteria bacterium CG_4_10_14_0_8_um_filter_39_15]|nr:MAG: hypothetical protein COY91_01180 [Candidatus Shapirobacteria bacterium CG_4_10_14_0_8_um_filter_39_15]PJE68248.1 MAG: hypothetical protein COU94_02880 [Candidatus Shapirobacteria bacterium CG10_big_fil_rev_8_21_14_0_10_38_8]
MNRTVLQIPVSKNLRIKAEEAALAYGFSSLQEVLRVFMNRLANKSVEVSFQPIINLSTASAARLEKMDKDFEDNKNIFIAKDLDDLKRKLAK